LERYLKVEDWLPTTTTETSFFFQKDIYDYYDYDYYIVDNNSIEHMSLYEIVIHLLFSVSNVCVCVCVCVCAPSPRVPLASSPLAVSMRSSICQQLGAAAAAIHGIGISMLFW